jgi:hypothetical protein
MTPCPSCARPIPSLAGRGDPACLGVGDTCRGCGAVIAAVADASGQWRPWVVSVADVGPRPSLRLVRGGAV